MKSLQELNAIRERMQKQTLNRDAATENSTRGIAAGAKPVMSAFLEEVSKRNLKHVVVSQTGCIGMCKLEPIVEVFVPGQEKVTYVKVTPEKVSRIVAEHIVNNQPVKEFTVDEK